MLLETPKGFAEAHFLIERGADFDFEWVTFIQDGEFEGQCWTFQNPQIRQVKNETMGRLKEQSFKGKER